MKPNWKPLPTALAFALIAPAFAVAIFLGLLSPAIVNLGPFESGAFWELVSSLYIIGAPPMFLAGLLVGAAATRGARLPSLTLQSGIFGGLFGAVSALFWSFLGAIAAAPSFGIIAAIAAISAGSAFLTALLVAVFSLFRRRGAKR